MKKAEAATAGSPTKVFDPFGDRISRDIRNALSEAFVAFWEGAAADYTAVAAALRRRHRHPVYRAYIDRRLADYRSALAARRDWDDPGLLDEMIVLWNRELFFEVHELLESHWHVARGARREVLKALIHAAGVYVHREAGRPEVAAKLGRRVRDRLDALRPHLTRIKNLDALCKALVNTQDRPPQLEGASP